jgi:DNA transformation protein
MKKAEPEIAVLRNLGPVSQRWLSSIGVHTEDDLRRVGAVNVYRLLTLRGERPSLNLVWGIEASLRGVHWTRLPPEVKAELRRRLDEPWDAREVLETE